MSRPDGRDVHNRMVGDKCAPQLELGRAEVHGLVTSAFSQLKRATVTGEVPYSAVAIPSLRSPGLFGDMRK